MQALKKDAELPQEANTLNNKVIDNASSSEREKEVVEFDIRIKSCDAHPQTVRI